MSIGWVGGLLALLLAYLYVSDWFRSKRCERHGVFGRCGRCEEETEARARAKRRRKPKRNASGSISKTRTGAWTKH